MCDPRTSRIARGRMLPPGDSENVADPRPCSIDQNLCANHLGFPAGAPVDGRQAPNVRAAVGGDRFGPGADRCPAIRRIPRVEDHQAGIVDPTVGVFEAERVEAGFKRPASLINRQVEGRGRRQKLAAAEMVIEEQTEPKQPRWTQSFVVRQHEAQRPDDVGRHPPQHFALHQGFAHQAEFEILKIAQSAVDQLCCRRGCPAGKVRLLAKVHR